MSERGNGLRSSGSPRVLGALGLVSVLGILLPATLLTFLDGFRLDLGPLLGWALALVGAARLSELVLDGRPRLLELTFYVYVYVWLGLAPLLQLSAGHFPWPGEYSHRTITSVWATIWLSIPAYELGLRLGTDEGRSATETDEAHRISLGRAVLLASVSSVFAALVAINTGDLGAFFVSRSAWSQTLLGLVPGSGKAIGLMVQSALTIPAFVSLMVWIALWRFPRVPRSLRTKAAFAVIGAGILGLNVLVNNPMASARAWFGTVVLGCVLVALRWRRTFSSLAWSVGLVCLFVMAFPYADLFRHSTSARLELPDDPTELTSQLVSNGDYASFQQVLNAHEYVFRNGHSWGMQFAGALFVWVPRAVWSDKPIDSADLVATSRGYAFTNLEMPLWGELYLDFGMLGVLGGFLLFGRGTRWIQRRIVWRERFGDTVSGLAIAALAGYQILLIRGDLMSSLTWFFIMILCVRFASPRRSDLMSARRHSFGRLK